MRHLDGSRIRGKHTTVTDSAFELCKFLIACEYVDGVKLGLIVFCEAHRPKLKLEAQQGWLKLEISGCGASQIILAYCQSEHLAQAKELVEQKWQELYPNSGKKTKVHNKPKNKNHLLVKQAIHEERRTIHLVRQYEREQERKAAQAEQEARTGPHIEKLLDYCMVQRIHDPVFRFEVRKKPSGKSLYNCQVFVDLTSGRITASSGMQSSRIQSKDLACKLILGKLP